MYSENIGAGPVIGLTKETNFKELREDLLWASLIPIAVVHNPKADAFKFFKEQYPKAMDIEAVLVTIEYYENFE